eukprot:365469-Chlamydomonas_euryale.AAC.20
MQPLFGHHWPPRPQEAMQLASTVMVAWLRRELWPGPDTDAGCARFEQWAEEQRVAGHLTLEKRA